MGSKTRLKTSQGLSIVRPFSNLAPKTLVTALELIIIPPEKAANLKITEHEKWIPLDIEKLLWL